MAEPIENHGIVGDMRTTALVALDGTIDFMCWPRFDSPSIFASLLDEDGGSFLLTPVLKDACRRQLYVSDSNVLLSRFLSKEGVAEISDFMPVTDPPSPQRLIRRAKAVRGSTRFRMTCRPRFNYGRSEHTVEQQGDAILFRQKGGDGLVLRLHSSVPLTIEADGVTAAFELQENHTACFVMEDGSGEAENGATDDDLVTRSFKATLDFWRGWVARSSYHGRWRDIVTRSSLVLKLLTSSEHGSMVAAATFGLPEDPGGVRNWDYRYAWLRDSAFTVYAFLRLGHSEEAAAFMRWLAERATHIERRGGWRVMYKLDGSRPPRETELSHWKGYLESAPVRIGNDAIGQLQLDIFGELLDAIYLSDANGQQVTYRSWRGILHSMEWLIQNWQQPDEGIWEVRGGRQHFLHSRLMCWVAFDRCIRLANKRGLPAPLEAWIGARDAIYREIHEEFWNEELGSFVQVKGGQVVDASCLLMPLVRFIPATDPRFRSTLDRVGRTLVADSLVYRYANADGHDGLDGTEGTFTMCSFWYVECLARAGDLEQARFLFEKMLGYANHVGLFAEELGPAGDHLGNFPQAFTHLALISAAYYLDRALSHRDR